GVAIGAGGAVGLGVAEGARGWTPRALIAASRGWMLGARMLLRHGRACARALPDEAGMVDLIDAELLGALDPAEGRLLRRLLPLDGLDLEIAGAALRAPLPAGEVRALARSVLFLSVDGAGRVQMHDLLKAAVRQRWGAEAEEDRVLRTRAAAALIGRGALRRGLSLLSQAGAWEALVAALDAVGPTLADAGDFGILLAALEPMPEAVREASVAASYWYGVSLLNLDPPRARVLLEAALEAALARGDPGEEALLVPLWTACADGVWLEWRECGLADPLLARLPALAAVAERQGQQALLARGAVAALSIRDPAHPDFPAWEAQSLAAFFEPAPRHEAVRRGIHLFFRYCWGEGARWKAEQVRTRLDHLFGAANAPLADVCTRLVATTEFLSIFEPRSAAVFAALEQGLAATARHGQGFWDVTMINAALYRAASLEDGARLDGGLALLAERLGAQSNPNFVAIQENFLGYRQWLAGRPQAALGHFEAAHRLAVAHGFALSPLYYGLAIAGVLPALGRAGEARRWMRDCRRAARAQRSRIISFMALLRGAALAAARPARALRYLRPALAVGAAERLMVHPYLRRGEMAALLGLAARHGIEPEYVAELAGSLGLDVGGGGAVRLLTLGTFDIVEGGASRLPPGKSQRVPARLALHLVSAGGRGVPTEELVDRLWPEVDLPAGRKRLKSAVYRLRQLIGDAAAVRVGTDRVALDAARIAVDAWELEALAAGKPGGDALQAALRLHPAGFGGPQAAGHPELLLYGQHLAALAARIAVQDAEARLAANEHEAVLVNVRDAVRCFGYDETLVECAEAAARALGRSGEARALEALTEL
ncbi:hypothetical protein, partial [Amaricoccus sp.]|uniref:hypothetical protein n=1 Tax=Amaricoccus sp. TaxID=1872485 RepID=UPI0026237DF3